MQQPLTIEQAKALRFGDMLYSTVDKNADKTPVRWKVNGKVQTWARSPHRIRVPLKNGLRNYDALTETDFHYGKCELVSLTEE